MKISIEIHQNLKCFAFLLKFHSTTSKIEIIASTSPKNFMKASFKSTGNSLFVIICFIFFGRMGWKKFTVEVCIFCLTSIKTRLRSIKISNFLLFRRNFSQNVNFERKNSTMKHVILTMSISLESLSVTLSAGILLIMCSVLRCVKIPTFDEIIRNRLIA